MLEPRDKNSLTNQRAKFICMIEIDQRATFILIYMIEIDQSEGYIYNEPITEPQGTRSTVCPHFRGVLTTKELSWTKAGACCHLLKGVETGNLQGSAPSG